MRLRNVAACLLFVGTVTVGVSAELGPADRAAGFYAEGSRLLKQADFAGALEAFKQAAKADRNNQAYLQEYVLLRRITNMRQLFQDEPGSEDWEATARALHSFYHQRGILGEALKLDRRLYATLNTGKSAVLLAGTQLALDMNAETVDLLSGLGEERTAPRTQVLLGVALARVGRLDEAKAIAERLALPDDAGAARLADFAALHAATGNTKAALGALTLAFERTPPSQLEAAKTKARQCKDFGTLRESAAFAQALKTESKVVESKCSGGKGCGKCPHRAKCGMNAAGSASKPEHGDGK